jgi:hypothetical protein
VKITLDVDATAAADCTGSRQSSLVIRHRCGTLPFPPRQPIPTARLPSRAFPCLTANLKIRNLKTTERRPEITDPYQPTSRLKHFIEEIRGDAFRQKALKQELNPRALFHRRSRSSDAVES